MHLNHPQLGPEIPSSAERQVMVPAHSCRRTWLLLRTRSAPQHFCEAETVQHLSVKLEKNTFLIVIIALCFSLIERVVEKVSYLLRIVVFAFTGGWN